jgi:hypothetical protein
MTVRQVIVYIATCDGCGRELGQGYGHRETYDTADQAQLAASRAGWSSHPDGQHYCQEGQHQ